jgi:hypothetical protein
MRYPIVTEVDRNRAQTELMPLSQPVVGKEKVTPFDGKHLY